MKWLDDLAAIPADSLAKRALLSLLLGAGVLMTAMGSMFWAGIGSISIRFVPMPVIVFLSGASMGLWAAGGTAIRRKAALWGVVGYVLAFHLEEATVHWIGPFPGSITGTRVGILGTLGTLLALAAVLLLHVEVERHKLARELARRGADASEASAMATSLSRVGSARILGIAAGVAAIGALVRMGEVIMGDQAGGGVQVLFIGAALLLGLAFVLVRFVPKRAS